MLRCHILLCPLFQQIPDILRVGAKRYFGQTALGGPFHVILWVENTYQQYNETHCSETFFNLPVVVLTSISYACLVVLLCVFRACEVQGEEVVMAVCLVLGWSNVMFFARGFEMLGPYVIMIQKVGLTHSGARYRSSWVMWKYTHTHLYWSVFEADVFSCCFGSWGSPICVCRLTYHVSHFPLDYIWRPDKVYVAEFHCAHWVFHLWVYSGQHAQTCI